MGIVTPTYIDEIKMVFSISKEGKLLRDGEEAVGYFDKSSRYWKTKFKGKSWLLHRLLYCVAHGFLPPMVDHKDRNVNHNYLSNLRAAVRSQNTINSTVRSDNTSGFKGVTWHKGSNKWHSSVYTDGKRYYCGIHDDINEAAKAYNEKVVQLFGEYAVLNVIKE